MDKWTVARALKEIASYIELSEPNPFKARAFERAARRIESLDRSVDDLVATGDLYSTPGIGRSIGPIVADLVTKGHSAYLDEPPIAVPARHLRAASRSRSGAEEDRSPLFGARHRQPR